MTYAFDRSLIADELAKVRWRPRFRLFGSLVAEKRELVPTYRDMFRSGLILGASSDVDVDRILKSCLKSDWVEVRQAIRELPSIAANEISDFIPDSSDHSTISQTSASGEARLRFVEGLVIGCDDPQLARRLIRRAPLRIGSAVSPELSAAYEAAMRDLEKSTVELERSTVAMYSAWSEMLESVIVLFVYINPAHSDGLIGMSEAQWIDEFSGASSFERHCSHCNAPAWTRQATQEEINARSLAG